MSEATFRALCAELADQLGAALDFTVSSETRRFMKGVLDRARAALTEPAVGPAAPSDKELRALYYSTPNFEAAASPAGEGLAHGGLERCNRLQQEQHRFREPERRILCDILANGTLLPDPQGTRYGTTPAPVAVAERLPGEGECDAEGRCWFYVEALGDYDEDYGWKLLDRTYGCNTGRSHWLPFHALPLPAAPGEGTA